MIEVNYQIYANQCIGAVTLFNPKTGVTIERKNLEGIILNNSGTEAFDILSSEGNIATVRRKIASRITTGEIFFLDLIGNSSLLLDELEATDLILPKVQEKDHINPSHYKQYPVESIEMMLRIFGPGATYNFCILTAFKYRMRLGHKDDIQQELKKEKWYMDKAAEIKSQTNDKSK